jgi:two-component system LytT family sensor kinase
VAGEIAAVIKEETGVGAVAVTDTTRVLGWAGIGGDHHKPGDPIASALTRQAIDCASPIEPEQQDYACTLSQDCPLRSVLIVPLQVDGSVLGTVKLFEPDNRKFQDRNKTLGQGIGALLSSQLLISRYKQQKDLLVAAELKLLRAQVNPHFLFNALNTIVAVTRTNPAQARELLVHLSHFFRKNLAHGHDFSTLEEEIEHVSAYLEIEKARFRERLCVEFDLDPSLLNMKLPTFTLQPLIENAIKHGLSETIEPLACISAREKKATSPILMLKTMRESMSNPPAKASA